MVIRHMYISPNSPLVCTSSSCSHLCMVMRGVEKSHASTVTSVMLGCFRDQQKTREEFLSLLTLNSRK